LKIIFNYSRSKDRDFKYGAEKDITAGIQARYKKATEGKKKKILELEVLNELYNTLAYILIFCPC
jgi:hypothetical protein